MSCIFSDPSPLHHTRNFMPVFSFWFPDTKPFTPFNRTVYEIISQFIWRCNYRVRRTLECSCSSTESNSRLLLCPHSPPPHANDSIRGQNASSTAQFTPSRTSALFNPTQAAYRFPWPFPTSSARTFWWDRRLIRFSCCSWCRSSGIVSPRATLRSKFGSFSHSFLWEVHCVQFRIFRYNAAYRLFFRH